MVFPLAAPSLYVLNGMNPWDFFVQMLSSAKQSIVIQSRLKVGIGVRYVICNRRVRATFKIVL